MALLRPSCVGLVLVLALHLPACTPNAPDEHRAAALTALDLTHGWLEQAGPDDDTAFGFQCLDAWNWFMFSEWHPDAIVRARATKTVDARLRALRAPSEWTAVTLSYWSLALRLMAHHALPMDGHLAQLADVDVAGALARTSPTTRWWTLTLLRQAGAAIDTPDAADTFLAGEVGRPPRRLATTTLGDLYTLYHEIAPAAGLGLTPLVGFSAQQIEVARAAVPVAMAFGASAGDSDALAEALVVGALLDLRDTDEYRAGLRVLLGKQNADGSFRSARDRQRRVLNTDHYRHVVVVTTFALLTSLAEYAPADGG